MTDLPDPSQTPADGVVNPSAVPPATKSVLADLMIVATFFPLISKLVGQHDVIGLIKLLQTSQGAVFLSVVIPIAASAWRARNRVLRWARAIRWARAAPNSLIQVKQATPPPAA